MKKSEAIEMYRENILEAMRECYETVAKHPDIEEDIYIWEDGEIEILENVRGGSGYLKAKDSEPRELFYVTTVNMPMNYDPWDFSDYGEPEDEEEAKAELEEIISWLVENYDPDEALDEAFDRAVEEEEMEAEAYKW